MEEQRASWQVEFKGPQGASPSQMFTQPPHCACWRAGCRAGRGCVRVAGSGAPGLAERTRDREMLSPGQGCALGRGLGSAAWASPMKEVGVGFVTPFGSTWAGKKCRSFLSSWQGVILGHLRGTRCWADAAASVWGFGEGNSCKVGAWMVHPDLFRFLVLLFLPSLRPRI